jgi:hypothetical protein
MMIRKYGPIIHCKGYKCMTIRNVLAYYRKNILYYKVGITKLFTSIIQIGDVNNPLHDKNRTKFKLGMNITQIMD